MTSAVSVVAIIAICVVVGSRLRPRPPDRRRASRRTRRRPAAVGRACRWRRLRRGHRRWERPSAVAAWCDDIAAEIRSGSTVRVAVLGVEPGDDRIASGVADIRRRLDRGSSIGESCRAVAADPSHRRTIPEFASALTVIAEAADIGGGAGLPIERVAAAARLRAADELDRASQSAQARLSAHVLTLVPICVFVVLAVGDRRVVASASSANGVAVLTLGFALNVAGWLWMQAIIRGRER